MIYTGVVEDIDDPLKADRVRVRVFGLHTDDKNLIPTNTLPWAQVMKSTDSASISGIGKSAHGLVCGSWVKVVFEDPECQYPLIIGSISGVSRSPHKKSSIEEVAFESAQEQTAIETQTKRDQRPAADASAVGEETTTPPNIQEACEANVDISGFRSKFNTANVNFVLQACCDSGITNPFAKIAILANVAKECGFKPKNESLKYSVKGARETFPTKTAGLTDYQLAEVFKDEESAGNFLYGGRYGNTKDEGYKFRGRGFIQITFKSNYIQASKETGVDLVSNPDKLNEASIAAKSAVKFILRSAGGLGLLNGFKNQEEANRQITQIIGGKGLNLDKGIGAQLLTKVMDYSKLGKVIGDVAGKEINEAGEPVSNEKPIPIGNPTPEGRPSDGLSHTSRTLLSSSSVGFKDPNGIYPLPSTIGEPDTNRLTRNNTKTSVFQTKKKMRKTGIKNIGGDFSQPEPPYNPKYPYNRGYFSESGHALEFDDTQGNERIDLFHKSGTFIEMDSNGNRVNRIVGSDYLIIERNGYIYIDGTVRISTGGSAHLSIAGDVNLSVDGNFNVDCGGDFEVKAGGNIRLGAQFDVGIRADNLLAIDSTYVYWQKDKAPKMDISARDAVSKDYPEQLSESIESSQMITIDGASEEELDILVAQMIVDGKVTKEQIDTKPEVTEKDEKVPPLKVEPMPGNCEFFANKTEIPESTQMSRHFTLADLTTKCALANERNKLVPWRGLSVAELACNLKKLAENALDPIKDKYPNMFVTNTFRLSTGNSRHGHGKCADLQFRGVSNKDYFEIAKWIKDNIPFERLALEGKNTGTGAAWIHIEYSDTLGRKVESIFNHKKVGDGLHQMY